MTIPTPMVEAARKMTTPDAMPHWGGRETAYFPRQANTNSAMTKMVLSRSITSIESATVASNGVLMLKWDAVPRAACRVMKLIWHKTQREIPQLMICFPRLEIRRYASIQATVRTYAAMDCVNLIGLNQGLTPDTSRESKGRTINIASMPAN